MSWGFFTDYGDKLRALVAEIGDNPQEIIRQFITEHYDGQAMSITRDKVSKALVEWAKKTDPSGEILTLTWATINRCQPDDPLDFSFTDKTYSVSWYGKGSQWRVEEHRFKRQRKPDKKRYFQRVGHPTIAAVVYVPLYDDCSPIINVDFSNVRDWD